LAEENGAAKIARVIFSIPCCENVPSGQFRLGRANRSLAGLARAEPDHAYGLLDMNGDQRRTSLGMLLEDTALFN
jgi:hypothetical protein